MLFPVCGLLHYILCRLLEGKNCVLYVAFFYTSRDAKPSLGPLRCSINTC